MPKRSVRSEVRERARAWVARLEPRHRRTVLVAAVAAVGILPMAVFLAVSGTFDVHCRDNARCVTIEELVEGAPIPEATHLYDRRGEPLADVDGPRRRALLATEIPPLVAEAFVAVEDARFWDHGGIDLKGVGRAFVRNLRSGEVEEGASTIAMQLVRTLWAEELRETGRWRRKMIEARLAPRLVDELGHERVLALYLNAIYMGNGLWGIDEAARHYFGVPAAELDAGQVATLVGMTRGPELYHPRRHPERTKARRDVVLGVMARAGVITPAEADEHRQSDLGTVDEPERTDGRSYFSEAVLADIRRLLPDLERTDGLRVFTTLDPRLQDSGETALREQLEDIESGQYGKLNEGERPLQAAAVALDPASGAVRAWIGGRDFGTSMFDRVRLSERQVGSLVKPFVVATALEQGREILGMISTDPVRMRTAQGVWSPRDHVEAGVIPIREALVRSSNRATVRLGTSLGDDGLSTVGRRMGLPGEVPDVPSAFIGAFEASLLDVTRAFAAFGNGGRLVEPYMIERIEAPGGEVVYERTAPLVEQVLGEVTSYVVLDALRDVVDRGTGWHVRKAGYHGPAAGKTGTTNEGRDNWFVGLTPKVVAGVWVGHDTPQQVTRGASGGALAGTLWGQWMRDAGGTASDGRAWAPPAGVLSARYHTLTGEAYPAGCWAAEGDAYASAWVPVGDYSVQACPSRGLRGWLSDFWGAIRGNDDDDGRGRRERRRGRGRGRGG